MLQFGRGMGKFQTLFTLGLTLFGMHSADAAVWVTNGPLANSRQYHTATLLANGKVLLAGGQNANYLASSELYDPATGNCAATGPMKMPLIRHTATLLPNGKVLVAGGTSNSFSGVQVAAEVYDPIAGTWVATNVMSNAR